MLKIKRLGNNFVFEVGKNLIQKKNTNKTKNLFNNVSKFNFISNSQLLKYQKSNSNYNEEIKNYYMKNIKKNFSSFDFTDEKETSRKKRNIGKFKNTVIKKKARPEIKTVFYDFGDKNLNELNENNQFRNKENKEENHQKENFNKKINSLEANEFNDIYNKIKNFDIDAFSNNEAEKFETKNQDNSSNNLKNKDNTSNNTEDVHKNLRLGKGKVMMIGKNNKKMDHILDREESLEHSNYQNQYNFILNLNPNSFSSINPFSSSINPNYKYDHYIDKISEQDEFNSASVNNKNPNINESLNDNEESSNIYNYNSNQRIDDNTINKEEYNKILLKAFYKLIDLIPKKPSKIQYYLDVVKLIDLKRVSDEHLIFYFMEKSMNNVIRNNMYNFCQIICKLIRFLSVLKFYCENLKETSVIDDVYYQFLDDHFINLSKKEIYLKRKNKIISELNSLEKSEEEDFLNQAKDYLELNTDNSNENADYTIKNKRLESFIRNELKLDKNEIFNINYNLENSKILNSYKESLSQGNNNYNRFSNEIKNNKESSRFKNSFYSDFLKENQKIKKVDNNNGKNIDEQNSIEEENFLDTDLNYFYTGKTVEELEDKIKNNPNNETSADIDKNDFFEKFSINDKETNDQQIDKRLILEYLFEEQNKYMMIFEQILYLNNNDCENEKRIIMIKLLKINFLIKFFKSFEVFNDPKFLCEILRTYRYLFIGNIDFKISEIIIKRIILLLHKAKFYNSFLLAKNVFMILRDLSLKPENHELIRQKSEYFKIIFNYLFEKINFNNLNSFSFKELGILIYMLGETQLGTQENYEILNKFILEEIGNSLLSKKMSQHSIKTFFKFVNFTLMGYCANLDAYDYATADKIIINFLKHCDDLPYKLLFNLSMSFYKLNHQNIEIWQLLYKHFIMYSSMNREKFPYNIKQVLDYCVYIKKRIPDIDEINRAFLNIYLENFIQYIERILFDKQNILKIGIQKDNQINIKEEIKLNTLDIDLIDDQLENEEDKEESSTRNIKIELNELGKEFKTENFLSKENTNKEEYKLNENEEYQRLLDKINKKELKFNQNIFSYIGDEINIIKINLENVLKFCQNINKKTLGFVNNDNLSNLILLRLRVDQNLNKREYIIFSYFDIDYSQINDKTIDNIIEILKIIDFKNVPNFNKFLNIRIFKSDKNFLLNKLINHIKEEIAKFKQIQLQLSELEFQIIMKDFEKYINILENVNNDENAKILCNCLKNEIFAFTNNNPKKNMI